MRTITILGATLLLCAATSLPAAAGTDCLCANGETVTTTEEGQLACPNVCELLGGGGQVVTNEDEGYEDDGDTVVIPRRDRGPARQRR
jgi:hypothetical protein